MDNSTHIRATFKHAVIYSLAGILQKAVGFIMLPFYAHLLGVEGYGILQMIEIVLSILSLLTGYAIASAITRIYFERQTNQQKQILLSTSLITMILLTAVVCIPVLLLSKPIASFTFGVDGLEYYIILAAITFYADTTSYTAQMYILIQQKSILFSVMSFVRLVIGLSLNIYFIIYLRLGVLGVLYSDLITTALYSIFMHAYTLAHTGLHFDPEDAKAVLKYSLPLLPGYMATFVRSNSDRIILRKYMGLAGLGIFSTAFKFAALMSIIIHDPFMRIWSVKRMEIADTSGGAQTISRMFTLYLAMSLFSGLLLSLEIPLLIQLLTPKEFWISGLMAFFAVTSRIAFNSYYHFLFGLLYGKATAKISGIQIVSAALSVVANIVFIKYYGLLGAFVGASIVYGVQCVITHIMAQKYYTIEYEWGKIVMMTGSSIILFLMIDSFSIRAFHWEGWLTANVLPFCVGAFKILHLDALKDGKLLLLLNEKFTIIAEGVIKALFSFSFIVSMFILRVIRWRDVSVCLRSTPLRQNQSNNY